ncbi:MAG: hypothetical protein BWY80_01357 [Firmicutes bacterium ADurb.Bin456]|nr:MAG: hypothetical protein BWY80_01357 [Firmicutes bacterium ADurb.Bin456]
MALGVDQADYCVGSAQGPADVGFLQDIAVGKINPDIVMADESVGNDEGAAQGVRVQTVPVRTLPDIDFVKTGVVQVIGQGRGICYEGFAATLFNFFHNGGYVFRTQGRATVVLTAVKLNSYGIARLDAFVQSCHVKHFFGLDNHTFRPVGCPCRGKVYLTFCHYYTSMNFRKSGCRKPAPRLTSRQK